MGNPASVSLVKKKVKSVAEEQFKARISPKQATPFVVQKLAALSSVLEKRILLPSLAPSALFVVAKD